MSYTIRECGAPDARPWLMMADEFSTGCGVVTRVELEHGCQFHLVLADGQPVGAFSTKLTPSTVWVVQAGGRSINGVSLAEIIMPLIEELAVAGGWKSIAFATRRKGLIRKMSKLNFRPAATVVRKVLP